MSAGTECPVHSGLLLADHVGIKSMDRTIPGLGMASIKINWPSVDSLRVFTDGHHFYDVHSASKKQG